MSSKRKVVFGGLLIMTLMLAIVGATYAYFTASQDNSNNITGSMAKITFNLEVTKVTTVDEIKGIIPMSNNMVEAAVRDTNDINQLIKLNDNSFKTCVDDNGNAVCQIYRISVQNTGSASVFLDGYVNLTGGSGTPTDITGVDTTMRWAEAFCGTDNFDKQNEDVSGCSTIGRSKTGATVIETGEDGNLVKGINNDWDSIVVTKDPKDASKVVAEDGKNEKNLSSAHKYTYNDEGLVTSESSSITAKGVFGGETEYDIINRNYIRISGHKLGSYKRKDDVNSALVFNQFLGATGSSNDSVDYYIVVWLSETGTNQTKNTEEERNNFYHGTVTFISAQGSEVTATFSSHTAVPTTDKN